MLILSDFFYQLDQIPPLFYFSVVLLGLMVGSFLNVVVYRLPKMMFIEWEQSARDILENSDSPDTKPERFNLIWPPSTCPTCDNRIKPWCNIPVFSYLFLKGQCHHCKAPISARYPIVESITALISLVVAQQLGVSMSLLWALLFSWSLWTLSLIDYDHKLLPDQITLPLLWLGLLLNLNGTFVPLESAVIGAVAGYLCLWSVYWAFKLITGKEGMGYGDFKLLAALGAWMGWEAIPSIILWSSLVGSVIGIGMILIVKHNRNHAIPFGPFLAAAGWGYFLWGETMNLNNWLLI